MLQLTCLNYSIWVAFVGLGSRRSRSAWTSIHFCSLLVLLQFGKSIRQKGEKVNETLTRIGKAISTIH
jgi:hypothetical protein